MAQGLDAARQLGAVHRDVKPANILVTRDGSAKLADLGLAVLIGDLRRRGRYEPLTAEVARLDRTRLESIVVKVQHNVSSNKTQYGGSFVPILHETLTIFRRPEA